MVKAECDECGEYSNDCMWLGDSDCIGDAICCPKCYKKYMEEAGYKGRHKKVSQRASRVRSEVTNG